jgi:hypothetical protein
MELALVNNGYTATYFIATIRNPLHCSAQDASVKVNGSRLGWLGR